MHYPLCLYSSPFSQKERIEIEEKRREEEEEENESVLKKSNM